MRRIFLSLLRDHDGRRYLDRPLHERPAKPRWLEKTPRNALNIPFLLRVFPNASFVYLHREPRGNMSSLIEAWQLGLRTGRFVTFANLPGWDRAAWCFLLPPGWRSMTGRSLAEIAAFQWATSNRAIIDCLRQLPRDRWTSVDYQSLIDAPSEVIARLCRFAELDAGDGDGRRGPLPLSGTTVSPPQTDKWRRHAVEIAALLPQLEETTRQIEALTRSH